MQVIYISPKKVASIASMGKRFDWWATRELKFTAELWKKRESVSVIIFR